MDRRTVIAAVSAECTADKARSPLRKPTRRACSHARLAIDRRQHSGSGPMEKVGLKGGYHYAPTVAVAVVSIAARAADSITSTTSFGCDMNTTWLELISVV